MAPPDPPNSPFHSPAYLNAGQDLLTWMLMRRRRIAKGITSPYAPGPSTPGPWAPTGAGSSSDADPEPDASPAGPPATPDGPVYRGLLNIAAPQPDTNSGYRGLLDLGRPQPDQVWKGLLNSGIGNMGPSPLLPDVQRAADEAGGQTGDAVPPLAPAPQAPASQTAAPSGYRGLLEEFRPGLLNSWFASGRPSPSPLLPDFQQAAEDAGGRGAESKPDVTSDAARPKQYQQGGLGAGSDWRNQFSAVASGNLSSPLDGQAADTLYPQRGQPLFTPPPSVGDELPEFHRPLLLLPDMLQLAAAGNTEGTDAKDIEAASDSDKTFNALWPYLVQREGGYSNTKTDSGGKTMHGISQSFVDAHNLQIKNVRNIVEEQAHNIVKKRIYYGRNIDLLPPELQPQVLDASLPAEYAGIKTLQQVLKDMGAKDNGGQPPEADGGIGKKTLEAIESLPSTRMRELRDRYAEALSNSYKKLSDKHPVLKKYLPGWLARTEFFRTFELPK
jgi:lysozyme family protein